jgi:uncharacterized cupredoxin-like copper-binding protein
MRRAARCGALLCAPLLVGVAAACSGSVARHAGAPVVSVTERDFKIVAPKHVPAGDVVFRIHNKGPDAHELIVVRADRALPLRADGITADEELLEPRIPGSLEPGSPGTRELKVHLAPGRYELICNMSGHYLGGMRTLVIAG